ncbi:hypothetical protein K502DRAFT_264071 [Neoconidiobolus thromboides FSU 785]|nr:hypothetical protein K502DRAFT_264071 [Neoconidiobolus thromboides FSU 785]
MLCHQLFFEKKGDYMSKHLQKEEWKMTNRKMSLLKYKASDGNEKDMWELIAKQEASSKESIHQLGISSSSASIISYEREKRSEDNLNYREANVKGNGKLKVFLHSFCGKKSSEYKEDSLNIITKHKKSPKKAVELLSLNFHSPKAIACRETKIIRETVANKGISSNNNDDLANFIKLPYSVIGEDTKMDLWDIVMNQGMSIKKASEQFSIGYRAAKEAIAKERKKEKRWSYK